MAAYGRASQAMTNEINNLDAGPGEIDFISIGSAIVAFEDLLNACITALQWLLNHNVISTGRYLHATIAEIWNFSNGNLAILYTHSYAFLLALFRDLCTVIEKIMKAIANSRSASATQDQLNILGGRPPQNLTSAAREAHLRRRVWRE